RKPRRRTRSAEPEFSFDELLEQARTATASDWDAGLRRQMRRALIDKGHRPEIAEGIARAYEKRPELIHLRPPRAASRDTALQ
ncbi:hypothetical protein L9G15_22755, partial [Shewanella sp. A3A]|nr:hypothetical protein [Shewanella ferrihydritica]